MPTDRPYLRGSLDEDTFDRWHDFANRHGLDVSTLLEAIGRRLDPTAVRLPRWQTELVADARRIRAERRDRRRPD